MPGTAVFMTGNPDSVPPALLHHFKHNKSLHERVLLLSIITEHVPGVRRRERVEVRDLGQGIYHVVAHFGFMQSPRVPDVLRQFRRLTGLEVGLNETSFYLGRETLIATGRSGDVALARGAVLVPVAQLAHRDRVLRPAARPRGRARHADRAVSATPLFGDGQLGLRAAPTARTA